MTSPRLRRVAALSGTDEGFTLIEAVIALVVLAIITSAVSGLMLTSLKVTHDDKARVAASNLAARELEITRESFAGSAAAVNVLTDPTHPFSTNPDPLSGQSAGPLVVDGIPFTVVRQVTPQPAGSGHSACDGGSGAAHPSYLVSVSVTWPNMGISRPVTNATMLTPNKDFLGQTQTSGYLAVQVKAASGQGIDDVDVSVTGPGGPYPGRTDNDGCAVVAIPQSSLATPPTTTNFTATLNDLGYVDQYGRAQPSINGAVAEGQITVVALTYDHAIELDASLSAPAGYQLPQTPPMLTLGNQGIQPSGSMTRASNSSGTVTQLTGLWPFTDGYSVWAGSCVDADPAGPPNSGSRPAAVVVAPGSSAAVTVLLAPVHVTVLDSAGNPVAAQLTATKPTGTTAGCSTDATLNLGATDATTGTLMTSLPYGNWQINAVNGAGTTASSPEFSAISSPQSVEVDFS